MARLTKIPQKWLKFLTFAPLALVAESVAQTELKGDFDCDGKQDTAVVSPTSESNLWNIAFGNGNTLEGLPLGASGEQVFSHDFNGNGCSDLFSYGSTGLSSVRLSETDDDIVTVSGLPCNKRLKNSDGVGGFVNNPFNEKNKLKIVLPNRYNRTISAVRLAKDGRILETLPFVNGNEWGNRRRFYTQKAPGAYGSNIVWVLDLKDGRRECIPVPRPAQRYD